METSGKQVAINRQMKGYKQQEWKGLMGELMKVNTTEVEDASGKNKEKQ